MSKTLKLPFNIQAVIPGNTPTKVKDSDLAPFYYTGCLRMTFASGDYIGTGTLITDDESAEETVYVLTCAHNLYDEKDGGEPTKVSFQRAFNDPLDPYKEVEAERWFYPSGYPKVAISRHEFLLKTTEQAILTNIALDYGLVKLKHPVEVSGLPRLVVGTDKDLKDLDVQINGYGYFDETMSHATGAIEEVGDTYLRYPISTKPGASGSSIMKEDGQSIVGIHTRAYSTKLNQGVKISKSVKSEILIWMNT